jgi:quercetin dioxygenase-like cupin family protein
MGKFWLIGILGLVPAGTVDRVTQTPPTLDGSTAKIEFENEQIRVLRVTLRPHQKGGIHSHPGRIGVTISANDLRVFSPDGTSKASVRREHEYFWSDSLTHQVENVSDAPMQNVEIEVKRASEASVEVNPAADVSKAAGTLADPVAVEQEPHHHVVFENQYVRVLDVVLKPGETTLFHRHSLDNVAVQLSDATTKRQSAGQDWADAPVKDGSVGFFGGAKTPYVHRIMNTGSSVFHVLDVEILR